MADQLAETMRRLRGTISQALERMNDKRQGVPSAEDLLAEALSTHTKAQILIGAQRDQREGISEVIARDMAKLTERAKQVEAECEACDVQPGSQECERCGDPRVHEEERWAEDAQ